MAVEELFKLIHQVYNGMPLALVEVWPQTGDLVFGDALDSGPWPQGAAAWVVVGESEGTVALSRVGGDASKASIRHSSTHDGLFLSRNDGETDGYTLRLLTPEAPPGQRRWRIARNLDRENIPEVHVLGTVSSITVPGPLYGRR